MLIDTFVISSLGKFTLTVSASSLPFTDITCGIPPINAIYPIVMSSRLFAAFAEKVIFIFSPLYSIFCASFISEKSNCRAPLWYLS